MLLFYWLFIIFHMDYITIFVCFNKFILINTFVQLFENFVPRSTRDRRAPFCWKIKIFITCKIGKGILDCKNWTFYFSILWVFISTHSKIPSIFIDEFRSRLLSIQPPVFLRIRLLGKAIRFGCGARRASRHFWALGAFFKNGWSWLRGINEGAAVAIPGVCMLSLAQRGTRTLCFLGGGERESKRSEPGVLDFLSSSSDSGYFPKFVK